MSRSWPLDVGLDLVFCQQSFPQSKSCLLTATSDAPTLLVLLIPLPCKDVWFSAPGWCPGSWVPVNLTLFKLARPPRRLEFELLGLPVGPPSTMQWERHWSWTHCLISVQCNGSAQSTDSLSPSWPTLWALMEEPLMVNSLSSSWLPLWDVMEWISNIFGKTLLQDISLWVGGFLAFIAWITSV